MRKALILISLALFISACGSDLAPTDATVTGPEDASTTLAFSSSSSSIFYRPLDFVVRNENGVALPDVEIEFFPTGFADLTDIEGNLLSNPSRFKTKTDDRGIGRVSLVFTVPGCSGTTSVVVTGGVLATVGSASKSFTSTATRTCAAPTS